MTLQFDISSSEPVTIYKEGYKRIVATLTVRSLEDEIVSIPTIYDRFWGIVVGYTDITIAPLVMVELDQHEGVSKTFIEITYSTYDESMLEKVYERIVNGLNNPRLLINFIADPLQVKRQVTTSHLCDDGTDDWN